MMMAIKENVSDSVRIMWQFRKWSLIYLWTDVAGKLFTPKEFMQNLESTPRLRGYTGEAVTHGAYTVF